MKEEGDFALCLPPFSCILGSTAGCSNMVPKARTVFAGWEEKGDSGERCTLLWFNQHPPRCTELASRAHSGGLAMSGLGCTGAERCPCEQLVMVRGDMPITHACVLQELITPAAGTAFSVATGNKDSSHLWLSQGPSCLQKQTAIQRFSFQYPLRG